MNRMSLWIAVATSWVAGLIFSLVAGDPWASRADAAQGNPIVAVEPMDAGP